MASEALAVLFLAAVSAVSVAECRDVEERQALPEQFSQLTNAFQETFKPSGGSFPGAPFQLGQFPSGFPNPLQPSRRQLDAGQFSQFGNKFQEVFKPLTENPPFGGFPGGFPAGNPLGSGGFLQGQVKRMAEAADEPGDPARIR